MNNPGMNYPGWVAAPIAAGRWYREADVPSALCAGGVHVADGCVSDDNVY